MLTNKKRFREWIDFLLLAAMAVWLAGCTPAGPRALLRGKRLMDQGKYADAVEELKVATSLISTNALAWNYLGLAYHHAGQPANAVEAYHHALKLNRDLIVVHYNLGCLLLEENRPDTLDNARTELTAFVLHQGNSTDGWLKLGTAQLRLAELPQAETSFKEVLRLAPQNVEAMNDLGVVQMQRRHNRDAVAYFNAALKLQPNYAPALLNLAVTQGYLNNPSLALQKYREYLALNPRPANWDAVNAVAQQLEQQLNPPMRPAPPTNLVATANPITNNPNRPPAAPTNISRPDNVAVAPRPAVTSQPRPPTIPTEPTFRPEVVKLPEAPTIRSAGQNGQGNTTAQPSRVPANTLASTDVEVIGEPGDLPEAMPDERRGLLQKLNPMGLFHRKSKTVSKPIPTITPLQPSIEETAVDGTANPGGAAKPTMRTISVPRYPYLSPMTPPSGNRSEAVSLARQGAQAQREHRLKDAVALYRAAAKADPSCFEAQTGLGLAAFDTGNLPESLRAYEMALAIHPDSFSTRFNFGLALKKANYIKDAAQELERLLASYSSGESVSHIAMVHLTLANLYAEQFHQPGPARAHYLKVLELDPQNAQATSIRYWLQENG